MPISILGNELPNPLRFDTNLKFPKGDLDRYPWLANRDRFYFVDRELGRGGFSIAYSGFPCDSSGIMIPNPDPPHATSPRVVIKVPNLDEEHTTTETYDRVSVIARKCIEEWALLREKLAGCIHSNLIFDLNLYLLTYPRVGLLPITVQEHLTNAVELEQWLVKKGIRKEAIQVDTSGRRIQNWSGIDNRGDWLLVARKIALCLSEVHRHRVVHGDVWAPNIYISNEPSEHAVLIDFGESFLVTPGGRNQTVEREHAYLAPERRNDQYISTEQVDVYSFGMLMFYLTVGKDCAISSSTHRGHERREFILNIALDHNRRLVQENPWIIDIIAHCTAYDPVLRPKMYHVLNEIEELSHGSGDAVPSKIEARVDEIARNVKSHVAKSGRIFARLIDQELNSIERLIQCCQTEMIDLDSTRDRLLRTLRTLYDGLRENDSWTTITTPAVWQDSGIGLDGQYLTASVEAIRRLAAIHRTYVISIEELGEDWAAVFASYLEKSGSLILGKLAKAVRLAIAKYDAEHKVRRTLRRSDRFKVTHREQFARVVDSLVKMVQNWDLKDYLCKDDFDSILNTRGLYLGLVVVPLLSDMRTRRADNPVSIMYSSRETLEHDRWLLVMTDIRGKLEEDDHGTIAVPQLRGVRVYKSAMGVPTDRKIKIERLIRSESVNIGPTLIKLLECCASASTDVPDRSDPKA